MSQILQALVIDNHSEAGPELKRFVDWGIESTLFRSVEWNMNSLHSTPEDLLEPILLANTIIVHSQFLYKDQLELFVDFFANKALAMQPVPRKYRFYVFDLLNFATMWKRNENIEGLKNFDTFMENLARVVDFHEVYSVNGPIIYSVHTKPDGMLNGYAVENWRK